ncbi:MAG: hypothetical protein M1827_000190 [Pycnora praestabilis]|nr:MAG: hypothetical protein M1827_000190 [Pycnora praestabilis]
MKNPSGEHICIFCANRFGLETVPVSGVLGQRRFVQSSRPSSQTAGVAAALRDDENDRDRSQSLPGIPQGSPQWGQSSFRTGLSAEEKRLRDLIQQRAPTEDANRQQRLARTSEEQKSFGTGLPTEDHPRRQAIKSDVQGLTKSSLSQRKQHQSQALNTKGPISSIYSSQSTTERQGKPQKREHRFAPSAELSMGEQKQRSHAAQEQTQLLPSAGLTPKERRRQREAIENRNRQLSEKGPLPDDGAMKQATKSTPRTPPLRRLPQEEERQRRDTEDLAQISSKVGRQDFEEDMKQVKKDMFPKWSSISRITLSPEEERQREAVKNRLSQSSKSGISPEEERQSQIIKERIRIRETHTLLVPKIASLRKPFRKIKPDDHEPYPTDNPISDPSFGDQLDFGVASQWQHIRKRSAAPDPQGQGPDDLSQSQNAAQADPQSNTVYENGRRFREEQSRGAEFVGFEKDSKAGSHKVQPSISKSDDGESEVEEQETLSAQRSEKEVPPVHSAGETTSRFSRFEEQPRGRDRDRAKRRSQFVSEYDEDGDEEALRAERRKQRRKDKAAQKAVAPAVPIMLPEYISIANLAMALRVRKEDFIRRLESLGFEETNYDYVLNAETAGLIAMEYNFEPIIDKSDSEDLQARPAAEHNSSLPQRPPVVTIMGHVDHGKTTLLDWLRKSSVAASEHGGITQHIGAFSVPMPSGKLITFLDTPGHAAFLSMRQRGAIVTDIVILVVAADDSVKPQTIEAIKHAQAAKVPIIVAINKIDKEDSNIEKVKQDLARHGVDVEDFGGETQVVCVSGKTGQGMGELEETVVALSEILDMRAEIDGQAEGWVLEATTKKAGRVATVLVRRGTIHQGDVIVAGSTWARVRTIKNEAGIEVDVAGPGTPVEIDGWREQPAAGDEVLQAPDEQKAKSVVHFRLERSERLKMAEDMEAVNESRKLEQDKREREEHIAKGIDVEELEKKTGIKEVFFIVKGDVSGSVEAVVNSIAALGNEEVRPHILRSGVGAVAEFDLEHAAVAKGHIISFNTPIEPRIAQLAETVGVSILDQNIIYRLVDDVKAKLSEKLSPSVTQRVIGEAEIAQVFDINVKGRTNKPFAGCKVRNGVINRTSKVRVLRDKEVVFDGVLTSLKNVKKDVTEMRKGNECGMGFENWEGFQVGDQVQSYEEKVEKRYL